LLDKLYKARSTPAQSWPLERMAMPALGVFLDSCACENDFFLKFLCLKIPNSNYPATTFFLKIAT
jgi:hypothetical protein